MRIELFVAVFFLKFSQVLKVAARQVGCWPSSDDPLICSNVDIQYKYPDVSQVFNYACFCFVSMFLYQNFTIGFYVFVSKLGGFPTALPNWTVRWQCTSASATESHESHGGWREVVDWSLKNQLVDCCFLFFLSARSFSLLYLRYLKKWHKIPHKVVLYNLGGRVSFDG